VLGMADVLLDTDLDIEQRRYLNALRDSAKNLLRIVNDILDFSKVEAGRLELEEIDFDLVGTVEAVVTSLSAGARDKGLSFSLATDGAVPSYVRGDPTRVRQVLTNLVGNAVKFTESGSVNVAVFRGEGELIRFEVTDSGVGIEADQRDAVLEAFTQADASTTRRFGGTGLGLTISRQLVDLMGGELDFISTPGSGSTFWFELPLPHVTMEPVSEGAAVAISARSSHVSPPSGLGRALLVEDTKVNQMVATHMLERLGYVVDVANNGKEAVDLFSTKDCYDVVLMDSLMPIMDGLEATAIIRQLEGENRHTPIIALTASAMGGDREKCLAGGMDEYVSKPIDVAELAAALARCRMGPLPPGSPAS
jgi:CheY-like chemotaxis protein